MPSTMRRAGVRGAVPFGSFVLGAAAMRPRINEASERPLALTLLAG